MGSPDTHMTRLCGFRVTSIKQIRGFGGLILQPEMKPPKIVPDPAINTERDESSQSHHTVSTTLLPSGINSCATHQYIYDLASRILPSGLNR